MAHSLLEQAGAFIQAGELTDALAALSAHLQQQPDDERARRMRLQLLRHLPGEDQRPMARRDFEQLHTPEADDYIRLALILEPDEALQTLAQGRESWPDHDGLTEQYIRQLIRCGQQDEALATLRAQADRWQWLQLEGDLLVEQGDDMTATARYSLALAQLDALPSDPYLQAIKARVYIARGTAYRRLGFYIQADGDYATAQEIIPDDPVISFNRGLVAWWQGDRQRAVDCCAQALDTASEVLRAEMLAAIQDDPRFAALRVRLDT